VFWFSLVPAFRFGESAIWTTAACLGAVASQQVLPTMSHRGRQVALLGLPALGGWCSYPQTLRKAYLCGPSTILPFERRAMIVPEMLLRIFRAGKNRQIP
jgi:hypothetical protein